MPGVWTDHEARPVAASHDSYLERMAELGVLDDAEQVFAAVDRGANPFTDAVPVDKLIEEARHRFGG